MAMTKFSTAFGDFEFSCLLQPDGTYEWNKQLRNTCGAQAERVESLEEVPVEVLRAFSRTKVTAQIRQLQAEPHHESN